jgi:hypothetical protein
VHVPYCRLWPVRLYNILPHYLTNGKIFEKKNIEHKMCFSVSSINFVRNISHSKRNPARFDKKKYICLHVKYPSFLSDVNGTWILRDRVSKNTQISNFTKIGPVGAELFYTDRRTDMMNLIFAFRNFRTRLSFHSIQ